MPINIYLGGGKSGETPAPQPSPIPSDLTAGASDVLNGKTFIGTNQTTETGTLNTLTTLNPSITSLTNNTLSLTNTDRGVISADTNINVTGNFGDALASDVLEGKTFTNKDGMNLVGTATFKFNPKLSYTTFSNNQTSATYVNVTLPKDYTNAILIGVSVYAFNNVSDWSAPKGYTKITTLSGTATFEQITPELSSSLNPYCVDLYASSNRGGSISYNMWKLTGTQNSIIRVFTTNGENVTDPNKNSQVMVWIIE